MTVTAASFRQTFTAFSSQTDYPDPDVNYYIGLAGKLLDAGRWGNLLDDGVMLFAAHNLSIEMMAKLEAENGNQPGMARGMLSGGGADKANFTYDTGSIARVGDGHWNLTTYGLRYKDLVRMVGAGPVQVGTGDDGGAFSAAWSAPMSGGWF